MLKKCFLLLFLLQLPLNSCLNTNPTVQPAKDTEVSESITVTEENNNPGVRENNLTELANPSGSYQFSGTVKDKETGIPLAQVRVSINSDNGFNKEIFTPADGKFELLFNRKGKAFFTFSLENYGTIAEIITIDQEKTSKEILLQRVAGFIKAP